MKNILLVICTIIIFSCQKDEGSAVSVTIPDVANLASNSSAVIVNQNLTTYNVNSAISNNDDNLIILNFKRDPEGPSEEFWTLFNVEPQFNIQDVSIVDPNAAFDNVQSSYITTWGGDLNNHEYDINPSEANFVLLKSYNSDTNELSGEYELHYDIDSQGPSGPVPPQRINMLNGVFKVTLDAASAALFE